METKNRLTFEQRLDMVKKYKEGTTVVQLSKNFNISRPTIYKILSKADLKPKNEIFSKNQEINKNMEDINTTFLGVNIDTVNGPFDFKIKKALKQSATLFDIMEFIKVTKFKLNMTMFDYFSLGLCPHDAQRAEWQVVVKNVTGVHKNEFYCGK